MGRRVPTSVLCLSRPLTILPSSTRQRIGGCDGDPGRRPVRTQPRSPRDHAGDLGVSPHVPSARPAAADQTARVSPPTPRTPSTCSRRRSRGNRHLPALGLNPGSVEILTHYAGWAVAFGEAERGAEAADRAIRLNPYYPIWAGNFYRQTYFMAGRHADALRIIERQPLAKLTRWCCWSGRARSRPPATSHPLLPEPALAHRPSPWGWTRVSHAEAKEAQVRNPARVTQPMSGNDGDPPGQAADRHRALGLQGGDVDHGHVIGQAVGDVELGLAPWEWRVC